ncbi:MAG: TetR family transcriptional regulator C-terminal domain-containing protein [Actinoallomurus sp.]
MEDLTDRVYDVIRASGLSQREFGARIGLDSTKLSKSLRGVRRFRNEELARIAESCAVSVDWLLRGSSSPAPVETAPVEDGRRGEILEAAWRLIARIGYHTVRVSDIAAACGASTAAVHYYFPTKQDLLNAALRHCVEQAFRRQSRQLRAVADARERLLLLIELQLPHDGQLNQEWSIWLQFWSEAALRPQLRAVHNDFYSRWRETVVRIVRLGQRQGVFRDTDPQAVSLRFTALTDGLAIQVLSGAGVTVETMRSALRDFVDRELLP